MRKIVDFLVEFFATGFYSGKIGKAPGTMGTFVAFLLFLPLAGHSVAFWSFFFLVLILSVPVSTAMEKRLKLKDPQVVVIDEIAGYFVTMAAIPALAFPSSRMLILATLGFVLFRIFDIWKPFPIKQIQILPSGWGIVVDDLIAGIYANIILRVIILFWPV